MAKRITEEMKVQINELYCKYGVKAQVARELGISPSSVSKYIIEGYKPLADREEIKFDKEPLGADNFIKKIEQSDNKIKQFCSLCRLSDEEKKLMEEIQNSGEVL